MSEHEAIVKGNQGNLDQKGRTRPSESRPSAEKSHAYDEDQLSVIGAPFVPRMDEHTVVLSRIPFTVQRQEFIMRLQQTYGNRYVQRLTESMRVQTKLTVSRPDDVYEQEADTVAGKIVGAMTHRAQPRLQEGEEESLHIKMHTQMQRQTEEQQAETELQRQSEDEDEEVQAKASLRRENANNAQQVDPGMEEKIEAARSGGNSMDENTLLPFAETFGADFSRVRVHTDAGADSLSQSLQARAFTTGNDIFFKNGEYNPGTIEGRRLLAHELTHTIQQGSATLTPQVQKVRGPEAETSSQMETIPNDEPPENAPMNQPEAESPEDAPANQPEVGGPEAEPSGQTETTPNDEPPESARPAGRPRAYSAPPRLSQRTRALISSFFDEIDLEVDSVGPKIPSEQAVNDGVAQGTQFEKDSTDPRLAPDLTKQLSTADIPDADLAPVDPAQERVNALVTDAQKEIGTTKMDEGKEEGKKKKKKRRGGVKKHLEKGKEGVEWGHHALEFIETGVEAAPAVAHGVSAVGHAILSGLGYLFSSFGLMFSALMGLIDLRALARTTIRAGNLLGIVSSVEKYYPPVSDQDKEFLKALKFAATQKVKKLVKRYLGVASALLVGGAAIGFIIGGGSIVAAFAALGPVGWGMLVGMLATGILIGLGLLTWKIARWLYKKKKGNLHEKREQQAKVIFAEAFELKGQYQKPARDTIDTLKIENPERGLGRKFINIFWKSKKDLITADNMMAALQQAKDKEATKEKFVELIAEKLESS